MNFNSQKTICAFAAALLLSGCGSKDHELRRYREVVFAAPQKPTAPETDSPHGNLPPGHPLLSGGGATDMARSADKLPPSLRSGVDLPMTWTVPEGWHEDPGSGMRMASFHPTREGTSVLTTVIVLGGAAGGLEQNVSRWLGQVNVVMSQSELGEFVSNLPVFQTASGQQGSWIDFNPLVEAGKPSSLAGIIPAGDQIAFIKMTGNREELEQEEPNLRALLNSIQIGVSE